MNKIWILVKREYLAAVKTKGFIISLVMLPIMMGGAFAVTMLTKDKVDLNEKVVLVIDESGVVGQSLLDAAKYHNEKELIDPETGDQKQPAYSISLIEKEADLNQQMLRLSDQIRAKELHAFVLIGPDVINPSNNSATARIQYFAENAPMDPVRNWISNVANNHIRQTRVASLGIAGEQIQDLFAWTNAEAMGLVSVDAKTGDFKDAKKTSELESFLIPYVMLLLIFMMIMMSAVPLLQAVMEEKTARIAEVLLGTVTPTQFMFGKVLGGLAVSLTTASIYVLGAVFTVNKLDYGDYIPYEILPWFFGYLIIAVVLYGSIMAALGSSCNDSKDAQSIQFAAMMPILIPLFVMFPVMQNPMSSFATTISLFPPFTPFLMLLRQATPVSIPMWQPIVGLVGVLVFTFFTVWAGGRVFRAFIIMHGKRPKFGTMMKYIIKG